MKLKFLLLLLSSLLFVSCSNSDDSKNAMPFRFLDIDQDVFVQTSQPTEISFLALDFDSNLSHWDITIENENTKIDCAISKIENTGNGYMNTQSTAHRIFLKVASLTAGHYTLIIKNNKSNQIHIDTFLVTSSIFNTINHQSITSYNFDAGVSYNNIIFFQDVSYSIEDLTVVPGIQSVSLENRNTSVISSIDFSIINNKVTFKIPTAINPGNYFLAVKNINGTTSYFKYDLLILEEKKPVITSVNKTVLSSGESMIIEGTNLRYLLNEDLLPTKDLLKVRVPLSIGLTNFKGTGALYYDVYDNNSSDFEINTAGTQIIFTVPSKAKANYFNDYPTNSYYEGTMAIVSGPYKSSSINVRFNYN